MLTSEFEQAKLCLAATLKKKIFGGKMFLMHKIANFMHYLMH